MEASENMNSLNSVPSVPVFRKDEFVEAVGLIGSSALEGNAMEVIDAENNEALEEILQPASSISVLSWGREDFHGLLCRNLDTDRVDGVAHYEYSAGGNCLSKQQDYCLRDERF